MDNRRLLPFAYSSQPDTNNALDTRPRDRATIDQNAASIYHTRGSKGPNHHQPLRPKLSQDPPSLKRKMGTLFNEKEDIKRRDFEFLSSSDEEGPPRSIKALVPFDNQSRYAANGTQIEPSQSIEQLFHSQYQSFHQEELNPDPVPIFPQQKSLPTTAAAAAAADQSVIPSSPPPTLPSDLDLCTQASQVPESPKHLNDNQVAPVGKKPRRIKIPSSEPDFGIDLFNRFRMSTGRFLSTDDDINDKIEREDRMITSKARQIILNAFDDAQTTINLEGMGLKQVPDEIKDLNDLVVFEFGGPDPSTLKSSLQLYLTKNKLRSLPPSLFAFTRLNVLGLRHNKLMEIPESISNLQNLTDLYVGTNRLKYLPHAIAKLPKLRILLTGPNPFIKIPDDAFRVDQGDNHPRPLVAVSKFHSIGEFEAVPSLTALSLNAIAKYDVTYQETRHWKHAVPKIFHPAIARAIRRGKYKAMCSECNLIAVDPYTEVFEWRNILGNKEIPFKKQFCCGGCYNKWKATILALVEASETE